MTLDATEWRPFDGNYFKQWYDVRVNGEIVPWCWPNGGMMMTVDGSGREWGEGACDIRPSAEPLPLEQGEAGKGRNSG